MVGGGRRTGLIPSQELEERRKAFVRQEFDYVHKIGICGTRVRHRQQLRHTHRHRHTCTDTHIHRLYRHTQKGRLAELHTLAQTERQMHIHRHTNKRRQMHIETYRQDIVQVYGRTDAETAR